VRAEDGFLAQHLVNAQEENRQNLRKSEPSDERLATVKN